MNQPMEMAPGTATTAALVAGDVLFVATIGPDRDGRLRLIKSRSGEVKLVDRTQIAIHFFTSALTEFLKKREIRQLTLVCSPSAGAHMAGVASYKVEAILQLLVPTVELVHSSAVTSFQSRAPEGMPGPDRERLTPSTAKIQARAILAAIYQLHKVDDLAREAERKHGIEQRKLARSRLHAERLEREQAGIAATERECQQQEKQDAAEARRIAKFEAAQARRAETEACDAKRTLEMRAHEETLSQPRPRAAERKSKLSMSELLGLMGQA